VTVILLFDCRTELHYDITQIPINNTITTAISVITTISTIASKQQQQQQQQQPQTRKKRSEVSVDPD
jgi:hypothetical protein